MEQQKRHYVKRKMSYWDKKKQLQNLAGISDIKDINKDFVGPMLCGEGYSIFSTTAASTTPTIDSTYSTRNRSDRSTAPYAIEKYGHIYDIGYPFVTSHDCVEVRAAIELCQRAYFGIAIIFNTIEMMVEFANTELFFDSGSKKSKTFFEEWFEYIGMAALKEQFFREYFRSGNIFLYRVDGKFTLEDFKQIANLSASENNKIPVKYVLLNPNQVVAENGMFFDKGTYRKMLSSFELERLRKPVNRNDQLVLESLPADIRSRITKKEFSKDGIFIPLDVTNVVMAFCKKQDYEPFAVPFTYRVLEDLNAKMELKKIDQAVARSVENAVLLITMGAKPDDGGVDQRLLAAMQQLFYQESAGGRVLVSDYTTKAEFVIPDLKKVLGPEKYEILDKDIKDGLQNIILGKENYSSTALKADMFLERLRSAREAFLRDFLQPEIQRIEKDLGFKIKTKAKFKDLDLNDETTMLRVITRMVELGVLTPEDAMTVIKTGDFPTPEQINNAQEKFIADRKNGYYNPIVGGTPFIPPPLDPNAVLKTQQQSANSTPKSGGRPTGGTKTKTLGSDLQVSSVKLETVVVAAKEIASLASFIRAETMAKKKLKKLSKEQDEICSKLAWAVAGSATMGEWRATAKKAVDGTIATLDPLAEVIASQEELNLPCDSAVLWVAASQCDKNV
jgi:hypothetical protein